MANKQKEGKIMFGLMGKSRHEKICSNLHSHIKHYGETNRKHCSEIESLKQKLVLENRRAAYWKMKFLEPEKSL